MNLYNLTKDDIVSGTKLLCIKSHKRYYLYTPGQIYKIIKKVDCKQVFADAWQVEDDDRDLNNLNRFTSSELLDQEYELQFIAYDKLSKEQQFMFQLHRDVDQL